MTIECTQLSKEYIKESINVAVIQRRLVKNPKKRVLNNFVIYPVWLAICIVYSISLIVEMTKDKSMIYGVLFGCLLGVGIIMSIRYISYVKGYSKALSKKDKCLTYTFTQEGIEYDNHANRKASSSWDSFQCMRILKFGVYLIPKEETGFLYGLSIDNLDKIDYFLKENNIELMKV